ncbi:hypothetical protein [Halosaccharopolyspora lacisalsi]|nr:hypothetical protein [Halosaccharopolyspora lacisalsi]
MEEDASSVELGSESCTAVEDEAVSDCDEGTPLTEDTTEGCVDQPLQISGPRSVIGSQQSMLSSVMRSVDTSALTRGLVAPPFRDEVKFGDSVPGIFSGLSVTNSADPGDWELENAPRGFIVGVRPATAVQGVAAIGLLELLLVTSHAASSLLGSLSDPLALWLAVIAIMKWRSNKMDS